MDYLEQKQLELKQKSAWIGYLLWLVLGGLGAHRFYSGKKKSGFLMMLINIFAIILFVVAIMRAVSEDAIIHAYEINHQTLQNAQVITGLIGLIALLLLISIMIWHIIDAFFIYKWIRKYNLSLFKNYKKMAEKWTI